MKPAGLIHKTGTTSRVLDAGFHAVAEYDAFGNLTGAQGELSSQYAWSRVAQIAFSRAGDIAAQKATQIILANMFIAALDLQGGGTLLAIAERPVAEAAAEDLTGRLDRAVADYIGPVPAPLAVLAGVIILALILASSGGLKGS
jgi:hypothetical protein